MCHLSLNDDERKKFVPSFFRWFNDGKRFYIVMELLGDTIRDFRVLDSESVTKI